MIIKKRQLFIDSPCVLSQAKTVQDPAEFLKKAEQELNNAHRQAEQIINDAQTHAQKIVENAKKEAQSILENAKKEALTVQNQIKITSQILNKIAEEFQKQLRSKVSDISHQLTDVLYILVKKITYKEIDRVNYQEKIQNILNRIVGMSNIRVTMNANDFEDFPQLVEQFKSIGAEVVKSATLKRGDIIVDTEIGLIDGTNQYAIEIVDQILEEVFGHERSS